MNLFDLDGHVALVTGGATGIGQTMARALGEAGASVVLVARNLERLEAAVNELAREGIRASAVPCDMADVAAIEALPAKVTPIFGAPGIVVNAAGLNPRKPVDDVTLEVWNETLDVNLRAPFFLARAFVPAMKERGRGRIINIASLQSLRALENGLPYGASKGGVMQLTRAMAQAWSRFGITANAVAPGFVHTNLTAPVFAQPEMAAHMAAQTMIGRNGELADLHGVTIFLASRASDYITAQTIFVDGGWTGR